MQLRSECQNGENQSSWFICVGVLFDVSLDINPNQHVRSQMYEAKLGSFGSLPPPTREKDLKLHTYTQHWLHARPSGSFWRSPGRKKTMISHTYCGATKLLLHLRLGNKHNSRCRMTRYTQNSFSRKY